MNRPYRLSVEECLAARKFGPITILEVGIKRGKRYGVTVECPHCASVNWITRTRLKTWQMCLACLPKHACVTHGHSIGVETPEFRTWMAMKSRCNNPRNRAYADYGGRGIMVCDKWNHDFAAFFADMGPRPPGLTIDRIDGNRGYEPGNCRWISLVEQQRSGKRSTRLSHAIVADIRARATSLNHRELALEYGVAVSTIRDVIYGRRWGNRPRLDRPRRKVAQPRLSNPGPVSDK